MAYRKYKTLAGVERYATRRYRSLDQRWISEREMRIARQLLLSADGGGDILDVPMGYGRFYNLLSEFGPVFGADINHFCVEYYNQRVCADPPAIEADAADLPFKDGRFTGSFCFRLLQHIHNRQERVDILRELARVSSKWVIASFYLESGMHLLHRKIFKQPSRITMISRANFNDEIATAGLKLHTLKAVVPGFHAHRIGLLLKA